MRPLQQDHELTEDKVVWPEDLTEGARPHGVHGAGLEVDEDGARHVLATAGLIVVDVDALELEVRVAMVGAGRVNAVLVRDDLPELPTNEVRSGHASMWVMRSNAGRRTGKLISDPAAYDVSTQGLREIDQYGQ